MRPYCWALGALSLLGATPAEAFTTRIHISIANDIRDALLYSYDDTIVLQQSPWAASIPPEDASAINTPLTGESPEYDSSLINIALQDLSVWAWEGTNLDYELLAEAVLPEWVLDLQELLEAVGLVTSAGGLLQPYIQPIIDEAVEHVEDYLITELEVFAVELEDEYVLHHDAIVTEYTSRLADAAPAGASGDDMLDHLYTSAEGSGVTIYERDLSTSGDRIKIHGIGRPSAVDFENFEYSHDAPTKTS